MNYRWPIENSVTERLLKKPLQTATDLIGKDAALPTFHAVTTRIPVTKDSFQKVGEQYRPEFNGDFKSILSEVYGQNNLAWAHIPTGLMRKLGFHQPEDFDAIAASWVTSLEKSTGLKGQAKRQQKIHNKAVNPSDYWHQDAPNSGKRSTTVAYQPKEVKQGHFELSPVNEAHKKAAPKHYIQRIPNTTNAYTLATLNDEILVHRAQKRQPLSPQREMKHLFQSYQRFPDAQ